MQASIYITYIEDVSAEVWIKAFEMSVGLSSLKSRSLENGHFASFFYIYFAILC